MIQIHNRALARRASTLQSRSSKTTNTTPAVASATPAPLVSAAGTNLLGNSTSETTLETQPLVDEEEEDDY